MNRNDRIRINGPKIVHEAIDGETVILNLDNGNYYSLVGVGADIWGFIEQIACGYESDGEDIEVAVNEFITELLKEGLAVTDDADTYVGAQRSIGIEKADLQEKKQRFHTPVLNKYSDMQDLLLLDPIHEVDEAVGWPTNKPELTNG
jgi:hypothetical protein